MFSHAETSTKMVPSYFKRDKRLGNLFLVPVKFKTSKSIVYIGRILN